MISRAAIAVILAGAGFGLCAVPVGALAQSVQSYAEAPSDALARNVRVLTSDPKNFDALVAAGRAALQTGDPQAAAGFFARAEAVNPNSYLPQAGMGASLVATGDASQALAYFTKAQRLGANLASIGADRGLAYDLLGNQAAAQSDYRAALYGADRDDARRRLALSLAISGQKDSALTTLQPLLQQRDPAAQRARAFILALNGDMTAADAALDFMMPGASARMDPFFRRLPQLASAQKAAAVHLGIFPDDQGSSYASSPGSAPVQVASADVGDRLASIEQLLAEPQSRPAPTQAVQRSFQSAPTRVAAPVRSAPVQLASVSRPAIQRAASPNNAMIQTARVAADPSEPRIWLQLASGRDPTGFREQFRKIRSREPSLFTGMNGFVAQEGDKARLLIGPFHSRNDAELFADALSSAHIPAFNWTSNPQQEVIRLP
jgi:tetratricopeptide (TPR) repeat protein